MDKITDLPSVKSLEDITAEAALKSLNNSESKQTLERIADAIGAAIQAYHDELQSRRFW